MTLGRRKLLLIGSGAVCAHALGCGGDSPQLSPVIDAGNEADVATGTLRAVPRKGVAIGRDARGIYAVSLICTHAGCDMSQDGAVSSGSIQCFCHGSVFDGQGNVLRGPARDPLPHLVVTADASGELTIHGDQTTAADTRLGT
ncbi:MAG: ubiquinol-cytochrome c reductase iron-sulfur subunit [Myxococcales bacterium]|nr:Rieske (2Fe-2S) protein [Myxococcales bacterium]